MGDPNIEVLERILGDLRENDQRTELDIWPDEIPFLIEMITDQLTVLRARSGIEEKS